MMQTKIKCGSVWVAVALIQGLFMVSGLAFAADEKPALIGTLTQLQGDAQVFSHPSREVKGPPPHALFEGEYYTVGQAQVGDKVREGNIVRTAPGGMVKIVFDNGDQVHVGSATAYRVFWNDQDAKPKTTFRLLYGKLRNIVSKVGPRNNLEVKTTDVVMGVRGTDFYVERRGIQNVTQVSTLRGTVEVKTGETKEAKPVEVKAGYSAVVTAKAEAKADAKTAGAAVKPVAENAAAGPSAISPRIELRKIDQGELNKIHAVAVIKEEKKTEVPATVEKEVKKLEAKAIETTLQDIRTSDPTLYKQVIPVAKEASVMSEDLNNKTVEKLITTAPPAPNASKPTRADLEDVENNAYERYFKIVN